MIYLIFIVHLILLTLTSLLLVRVFRLAQSGRFALDGQTTLLGFKVVSPISSDDAFRKKGKSSHLPKKQFRQQTSLQQQQRNVDSSNRIDSFAKAQIFAGLQMLDLKQKGVCLQTNKSDWLVNSIAAYFHGAAAQIVHYFDCSESDKEDILTFLITRNLNLSFEDTSKLTALNYLSKQDDLTEILEAGKCAAKIWLEKRSVPAKNSLFSSINEYGFII